MQEFFTIPTLGAIVIVFGVFVGGLMAVRRNIRRAIEDQRRKELLNG